MYRDALDIARQAALIAGEIQKKRFATDFEVRNKGAIDLVTDGTIKLSFTSCKKGVIEYDIPSINQQGSIPIERIVNDNVTACEGL